MEMKPVQSAINLAPCRNQQTVDEGSTRCRVGNFPRFPLCSKDRWLEIFFFSTTFFISPYFPLTSGPIAIALFVLRVS